MPVLIFMRNLLLTKRQNSPWRNNYGISFSLICTSSADKSHGNQQNSALKLSNHRIKADLSTCQLIHQQHSDKKAGQQYERNSKFKIRKEVNTQELSFREIVEISLGPAKKSTLAFDQFSGKLIKFLCTEPRNIGKFRLFLEEFIKEYNNRIEPEGYHITRSPQQIMIEIVLKISLVIVFLLSILIPERNEIVQEHVDILENEETVNFSRFLREYLSTGKVKSIFCYPYVGKLVAMLHPETIIQGKEFTGIGVHVEMTEDLAPSEIVQKIRDAEKLLNIEKGAQIVVEMDNTLIDRLKVASIYFILLLLPLAWWTRRRFLPVVPLQKNIKI